MRGRVRGVTGAGRVPLDRGWEVACAPAGSIATADGSNGLPAGSLGELRWIPATVPGTAAGALRAAGQWRWDDRRNFDGEDWWWRVSLQAASAALGSAADRGLVLGVDGIATLWDAWLDGEWIGHGDSMFRAHELELPAPASGAARELVIRCRSLDAELGKKRPRARWRVPMLEQQQLRWIRTTLLGRTPGWSPPCPAVGPWRPLWLETRPSFPVGEVAFDVQLEDGGGIARVGAQLPDGVERARLVLARDGERHEQPLVYEAGSWNGALVIARPARWWPHTHGEPARYHATIEAERGGEPATVDLGATGFRTIAVDQAGGDFQVRVNGVPVFCRGACWTPLDPVTLGGSPEAYRAAVAQLVAGGMNMIRIGGTMVYEDAALHDALDEHGVLLWQDLMFANMDYPEDPAFAEAVGVEVDQQLGRLAARPSLALVCGNSEGEQQAAMWGAPRERWAPPLFHEVNAGGRAARPRDPIHAVERERRRVPARGERRPVVVLRGRRLPAPARRRAPVRGPVRVGVPRVREHPRAERAARRRRAARPPPGVEGAVAA
jgi:beta-mannosidase